MLLRFTKMHGAGNDFVVLDGVRQHIGTQPGAVAPACRPPFRCGCDQILLVEKAQRPEADFRYRIFTRMEVRWNNAATVRVASCVSCTTRNSRTSGRSWVETKSGLILPRLEDDDVSTVNMGAPIFDEALIRSTGGSGAASEPLEVAGETSRSAHCRWATACGASGGGTSSVRRWKNWGRSSSIIRASRGASNAGFMQVMDRRYIRCACYERGSGKTLSCGTALRGSGGGHPARSAG